uniref:Anti-proliferative protein domain-containing protein n=1 Tax=Athene cunicularia TaxID=194338 RepID=A0A663MKI1_ATHCN
PHPSLQLLKGHCREAGAGLVSQGVSDRTRGNGFELSSLFPPAEHYKHHWFPLVPSKGSGYRCIRINHKMDPLIGKAAGMIGLSHERLFQLLPSELTLWVDPFEVSYRIGEDGSICVLYESPQPGGKAAKPLESRTSCKEEWRTGRSSPSKNYNMMTVSS